MDPVAALSQIRAEMRSLAVLSGNYRDDLLQAGFEPAHVQELVRDWHLNYWQTIHVADGDAAVHGAPSHP